MRILLNKNKVLASVLRASFVSVLAISAGMTVAGTANAQNASDFSFSGSATFTSDYRFRGISLSDKDFAIQGSFTASHSSGFYVNAWGSSIEQFAGSETEIDLTLGYNGTVGNLSTGFGVIAYTYPGSSNTAYLEVFGSVSGSFEKLSWTLGSNYAWDQDNIGGQDNIYVYLYSSMPLGNSGLSANGTLGYEDGAFGNDKWDWNVGLSYSFQKFSLGVSYVDSNTGTGNGDAGVMASISASF